MFLFLWLSCTTDVQIAKVNEPPHDTSEIIIVDSAEPSSEPSTPAAGISGYTYLHLKQVACPACVGETQEITITFSGEFHEPISDNHTEWLPVSGECTTNLTGIDPSTVPLNVGNSISIATAGHNFNAPMLSQGYYETTNIWESQLQRDANYNITTDEGDYSFVSSHGFDYIEPMEMLWIDPSYAFDAVISRSGTSFFWGPPSTDSSFMVLVAVYSYDGSQMLGYVACGGDDSGSMVIPSQYLQYPVGSLVAIHLSRHKIELVETNINNSYIETHMEWEVIGTGHIE